MKTCTKCKVEKDLSCFRKNKCNKDGLQFQCKECHSLACAVAYKKIGKDKLANRAAKTKEWRTENSEKVKKSSSEYKKRNRTKLTALENKRRASKINQTPSWLTKQDLEDIEYVYRLASFFQELSGGFVKYNVDHIVPLQGKNVRGLHVPWNLTVLKATENQSKGNRFYG